MKLRKLKIEDAPLMLEWMHDKDIIKAMKKNFSAMTLEDCKTFIQKAQDTETDLHLAIVDENDMYMGTVSLKHITNQSAEFAITIRSCALGKGYAAFAMKEILHIGMKEYGLKQIYWTTNPQDPRAVRFYEKNGYKKIKLEEVFHIEGYSEEEIKYYSWYAVYA